jgi:hypothetical protein
MKSALKQHKDYLGNTLNGFYMNISCYCLIRVYGKNKITWPYQLLQSVSVTAENDTAHQVL